MKCSRGAFYAAKNEVLDKLTTHALVLRVSFNPTIKRFAEKA